MDTAAEIEFDTDPNESLGYLTRIAFRNFYRRRALRLFPALGCVIIASVAQLFQANRWRHALKSGLRSRIDQHAFTRVVR